MYNKETSITNAIAMSNQSLQRQGLQNVTPPNWLGLVTDGMLWVSLLMITGIIIYITIIYPQQAKQQTIALAFRNANEISRGAQVKMMGSEIGYVDSIRIRHDRVNIIIKTNPGGITVPPGSTFTINFTGLAGAKSIEVIPPDKETSGRENPQGHYFIEEPIRLKDAMKYQTDLAEGLKKGAENFADFFGKKQPIEELQHNIRVADREMVHANKTLDNANSNIKTMDTKIANGLGKINKVLYDFEVSSKAIAKSTGSNDFGTNVITTLGSISKGLLRGQRNMALFVEGHHLQRYQATASTIDKQMGRICEHITPTLWYAKWDKANHGLTQFSQAVDVASQHIDVTIIKDQLIKSQLYIQQFNTLLINQNERFEKKIKRLNAQQEQKRH